METNQIHGENEASMNKKQFYSILKNYEINARNCIEKD